MHSKMFFRGDFLNKIVIEIHWIMIGILTFSGKYNFLSLFTLISVKTHFYCIAQWLILLRSLFKLFVDVFISWTTEKREVSSANSLIFVVKSSERLLIQIKNNNGTSIDPWGTSARLLVHESWQFQKQLMTESEMHFGFKLLWNH